MAKHTYSVTTEHGTFTRTTAATYNFVTVYQVEQWNGGYNAAGKPTMYTVTTTAWSKTRQGSVNGATKMARFTGYKLLGTYATA